MSKNYMTTARAFLIVFILLCYTLGGGAVYKYLMSFCVPAFFFLAGMGFNISEKDRFFPYALKKARLLILPYFAFGVISLLTFFIAGLFGNIGFDTSLLQNLLRLLYGSGLKNRLAFNEPLWILPCLFVAYLAAYGIDRAMKKIYGERKIIGYILLFIIFSSLGYLGTCAKVFSDITGLHFSFFAFVPLPFGLSAAVNMMPFFLLGKALCDLKITKLRFSRFQLIFGTAVGIFFGGLLAFFNETVSYTDFICKNYLIFLFGAILSGVGFVALSMLIPKLFLLQSVGKNAVFILCTGGLLINLLKLIPFIGGFLATPDSASGVICSVLVSALSIFICLLLNFFISAIAEPVLQKKFNRLGKKY